MTKKFIYSIFFFLQFIGISIAQEGRLLVEISGDTLLMNNYLQVKYTTENIQGRFEMPELEGLQVVSGPNTSTSMSMVNGDVTRSASYSFYAQALVSGMATIGPAYFETEKGTLEAQPMSIVVADNPDGTVQKPSTLKIMEDVDLNSEGNSIKKKRKAKRYKI